MKWPENSFGSLENSGVKVALSRQQNSRELIFRYSYIKGRLIISEPQVVFRLVDSDKLGFQQDCLKVTFEGCPFELFSLG